MTQNDPTDSALAAIASIFGPVRAPSDAEDHSSSGAQEDRGDDVASAGDAETVAAQPADEIVATDNAGDVGVDGYSRSGPGPLDSLRFKWTARRGEGGQYYVDETIGYASRPISTGPMPRGEVIDFIDARESAARQRFETLRQEMIRNASEPAAHQEPHGEE